MQTKYFNNYILFFHDKVEEDEEKEMNFLTVVMATRNTLLL